mmetsp:Transcript_70554/g.106738  ORF Transcript_70554/g.106738 Transcript_70554/m.106738 type:complete len:321 (-) Transcript_70554:2757-3719(-)
MKQRELPVVVFVTASSGRCFFLSAPGLVRIDDRWVPGVRGVTLAAGLRFHLFRGLLRRRRDDTGSGLLGFVGLRTALARRSGTIGLRVALARCSGAFASLASLASLATLATFAASCASRVLPCRRPEFLKHLFFVAFGIARWGIFVIRIAVVLVVVAARGVGLVFVVREMRWNLRLELIVREGPAIFVLAKLWILCLACCFLVHPSHLSDGFCPGGPAAIFAFQFLLLLFHCLFLALLLRGLVVPIIGLSSFERSFPLFAPFSLFGFGSPERGEMAPVNRLALVKQRDPLPRALPFQNGNSDFRTHDNFNECADFPRQCL